MKALSIQDVENNLTYTFQVTKAAGGLLNQFEGWEYPESLVSIEDVANTGGAVKVNSKFGRRNCSFVYTITCDVLSERRDILGVLRQTGYLKLIKFTTLDNLTLQFYAYITKVLAPYSSMQKPFLIELSAPDYRFYAQTASTNTSANASQTLTNAGNDVTYPTFKFNGPFSAVTLLNTETSETFTITYNLADGHYITVDTVAKTVLLDGVTSVYSSFVGDFFGLIPGGNDLTYSKTDSGANTNLVSTWRSAYNGV